MPNLFKRNTQLSSEQLRFLTKVSLSLKKNYPFLVDQCNKNFILRIIKEKEAVQEFNIVYNADLEDSYIRKDVPHFVRINNIEVWNIKTQNYTRTDFVLVDGLLAGFSISAKLKVLDIDKINVSNVDIFSRENEVGEKVALIIGVLNDKEKQYLNLRSSIEIEIEGKIYYTIKDFQTGNYLAIDKSGAIYKLIHDPLQIEFLSTSFLSYSKNLAI